jgi:para-nitrobenzyl esterase
MKLPSKFLTLLFAFLAATLPSFSQKAVAADGTEVTVNSGVLKGATGDTAISFKGVPYAAPPVGNLRWRDPQPVTPWKGIRDATASGHNCTQGLRNSVSPTGDFSEDCLYLNVWKPATSARNLPVMVWIHGGGFVFGGTAGHAFDGSAYVKRGVILVTINYRLGRFGFFAHPALTAAAQDPVLGNYGLADQAAALKWVQRNISNFGGDPKTVTIFGESAGGLSVLYLMTSPLTHGLFERVLCESGLGRAHNNGPSLDNPTLAESEAMGTAFAHGNGIDGDGPEALAKLRALSSEKVRAFARANGEPDYGGPMIDGKFLTAAPDDVLAAGGGARVPLMIGTTDADLTHNPAPTLDAAFALFGSHRAQAEAAYGTADPPAKVLAEMGRDREMLEPARYAAAIYASRHLPTYEYRFSYVAESERERVDGAHHASEIPYVFLALRKGAAPADVAMSEAVIGYWSAFGRTGDPNSDSRPLWPRYDPKTDVLMNFTDSGPKAMPDPWKARLDATADEVHDHP